MRLCNIIMLAIISSIGECWQVNMLINGNLPEPSLFQHGTPKERSVQKSLVFTAHVSEIS